MGMDTARTSVDVMVVTMAVGLLVVMVWAWWLVGRWLVGRLLWCGAFALIILMMTCRPPEYC